MAMYQLELQTTVSSDATSLERGAVLLQDRSSSERRAVVFACRSLTPTKQWYSQTDVKVLAVTGAVQRFDKYVRGLQFVVETGQLFLTTLF